MANDAAAPAPVAPAAAPAPPGPPPAAAAAVAVETRACDFLRDHPELAAGSPLPANRAAAEAAVIMCARARAP